MNIDKNLERAHMLIAFNRHKEAVDELKQALALDPNNGRALLLLSAAYTDLKDTVLAIQTAKLLVAAEPNSAVGHYVLSVNYLNEHKIAEAEAHIYESLQLNPTDSEAYAQLAHIYLEKKDFNAALTHAEEGLEFDPENVNCLNMRTHALTKLGRRDESAQAAYETLSADPDNAYSHTNVGLSKLENGDYEGAKFHFAEALRLEPSLEIARSGMLEALKARNFFYRYFLYYVFYLSNKTAGMQWTIIVGIWIGMRLLRGLATEYPFLNTVVIILVALIYLSWITNPLFNLMLRLDKTARHALTESEIKAANVTGVGLLVAVCGFVTYLFTEIHFGLDLGLLTIAWLIPTTLYLAATSEKLKKRTKYFSVGLSITGVTALVFYKTGIGSLVFLLHMLSFVAFQILYNFWIINRKLV